MNLLYTAWIVALLPLALCIMYSFGRRSQTTLDRARLGLVVFGIIEIAIIPGCIILVTQTL